MAESTLDFTTSLETDSALAFFDVMGSLAHVRMLKKCQIIPEDDADRIIEGLKTIVAEMENGEFKLDFSLEDIHTNVEFRLTELIGPAGGKLHTGRSRNDQVATDFRMYLRDAALAASESVDRLMMSLVRVAEEHGDTVMPGFTHMQHAQPVTVAHHYLAYAFKLARDADRFLDAYERMNKCPLGAAALAGTTYPLDREYASSLLGLDGRVTDNSLDGVSDRDYALELLSILSIIMVHLSRFSEEVIMWCSWEFKFIELDDAFSTGSSIMPQKKNPDIAELVRGKSGRVFGDLQTLLTVMKGLPLAYNKDMQEDKEAVFDALDTTLMCIETFTPMLATATVLPANMRKAAAKGFINATDAADYLVYKGLPFRDAYKATGQLVALCIDKDLTLETLPPEEYKAVCDLFEEDVYKSIDLDECVKKRTVKGSPSPECVLSEIKNMRRKLGM